MTKNVSIIYFKWDKISGVNIFLKDMKNENLLIYDNAKNSEATVRAKNIKIFESVIFEKVSVTIEFKSDKCRLLFGNNECIVIDGEEWISVYISFSQKLPLFGKNAIKDLESFPESVIYDFVNLVGATSKMLQLFDSKWEFHLIEMDNSDDPKIGFKVKTPEGYKVIAPEMALTICLKKFIIIYEKHIGKSVDEIKLQLINGLFTDIQKLCFTEISKILEKDTIFC